VAQPKKKRQPSGSRRRATELVGFALLGLLVIRALAGPTPASAAPAGDPLTVVGEHGTGAGQILRPEAIATDPSNGHMFVVDGSSNRIDEFTPWGAFVKAFGWDVAPNGVNEQQEVTVKATSGQFTLSFESAAHVTSTTTPLEHDATPQQVQVALDALPSIEGAGVEKGSVSVTAGASDPSSSRYVVAFSGGVLVEEDVAQLTATNVSLAGPTPSASVSTRADGTTAGTGLESCTAESGCKSGSAGSGTGQITVAITAVGPNGDVYVRNYAEANQRVQVFDPAGRFLFMFGGEVDKTTHTNVCTATSGDECGAGVPGAGPGEFSAGIGIAIAPDGNVFVADEERIQEFEADGTYLRSIGVAGKSIRQLALDPTSGDFLVTYGPLSNVADVHKLSGSGVELCSFPVPLPGFVATDASGHLHAVDAAPFASGSELETVLEFDGSCPAAKTSELVLESPAQRVGAIATNTAGDVLVGRSGGGLDYVQVYGPPPAQFEPPLPAPPEVTAQFALRVGDTEATVRAKINPQFWADTAYHVEYGTGKCSEGGCSLVEPAGPVPLGAGVVRTAVATDPVGLTGLEPNTTYHYRFVAQSSGGGPSYGLEATFKTFPTQENVEAGCSNQDRREEAAFSASLPDCRAYEMVSPLDKGNGDTLALFTVQGILNHLTQSTADGGKLTYSSYRAFPGSADAPYTSQYLARRGSEGWTSEALAPARSGPGVFESPGFVENDFKAFAADLCQTWMIDDAEPLLAPGAIAGFPDLYRREIGGPGCVAPAYEALTTVTPTGASLPQEFGREQAPLLQGTSADGQVAVFQAPWKMSPEAAAGGAYQVYEASGGQLALVCIRPDGTPLGGDCSVGSEGSGFFFAHDGSLEHAVSEDGSWIYWSAAPYGSTAGRIYLRTGGTETLEVSNAPGACKTTLASHFWGASADGSQALFIPVEGTKEEKLCEYSVASGPSGESSEIAGEVMGVAGRSEDLSYVYYVSREASGGPNAEGKSPVAGQPNLYLFHEGTKTFIATLAAADVRVRGGVESGAYSDTAIEPVRHVARATPSGKHLTFISAKPLTGSDSADAESGEADEEVFRYDAEAGQVACASCSPAGARPAGRFVEVPGNNFPNQWTAAMTPGADTQLHAPRALSDNGNRLFFTAYASLLPADVNGRSDVYEWEAPGEGGCTEAKAAYSQANEGCLYLISTGESEQDSELIESTPSGDDAFFTTEQSLTRQDPGLFDVYDARVGGGFPLPAQGQRCEPAEGSCQNPGAPPTWSGPASTAPSAGNPRARCPKGTRKRTKGGRTSCHRPKPKRKGPRRAGR
jgi:hypothetical protein